MGAKGKKSPRFRREGATPRVELTDDDVAILRCVHRHRFVSAEDLYRLFGGRSKDRLSRRLTLLYRGQFLDRPVAQIDRYGRGGSHALIYGLDGAGARFLKEKCGLPIGPTDWRARNRTYTRENLDHTVSISRYLIALEIACRARADITFIPFEEILARSPENTRRLAYPAQWEVPVRYTGPQATVHLAPDAIFGLRLATSDGQTMQSYVFLEIDRGTMTIAPAERVRESDAFMYRATVLRKLFSYAETWRQGLHKAQFGIPSARVLLLTTSTARAEAIRRTAQELVVRPHKVPASLFLFGEHSSGDDPLATEFFNSAGTAITLVPPSNEQAS